MADLGFVSNPLDRNGVEHDEAALARHRDDPDALSLIFAGDIPLLRQAASGETSLMPRSLVGDAPIREQALLGLRDGRPVAAIRIDAAASESFAGREGLRLLDLRSIAVQGAVAAGEIGMLAQAKALTDWHARHRFCANCGAPTQPGCAGHRRDCTACGAQHFPRTDPVAIMLVRRGDQCLLGRQARFNPGMYSCLAGFVSQGETIEGAVRREVFEEAGIQVGEVRYHASQPWPFPSSLMIGCIAEALDEAITIDQNELEHARWFSRDEVAMMLERRHPDGLSCPPPMAIAHHLMLAFLTP